MNNIAQTLADWLHLTVGCAKRFTLSLVVVLLALTVATSAMAQDNGDVDYAQSLPQMVAAGHYNWTNPNITAGRFPMQGTGIAHVEFKLFRFNRDVTSEDAFKAIKTDDAAHPWEPAKIEHLLSFGVAHPDEQRRSPIVALGSVADVYGARDVPCLRRLDAERHLNLNRWDNVWSGYYEFLAVRKLSAGS